MNEFFNDQIVLLSSDGYCSPIIEGRMRKDESAVIVPPEYKEELEQAHYVRYFKTKFEYYEYFIRGYYQDLYRPLTNTLIKPLIVHLYKS